MHEFCVILEKELGFPDTGVLDRTTFFVFEKFEFISTGTMQTIFATVTGFRTNAITAYVMRSQLNTVCQHVTTKAFHQFWGVAASQVTNT